jgi:hypothetical protein
MPLSASTLAQDLERVFNAKPVSAADAAAAWANAYQTYATGALSVAASLPVGAPANFGILLGAFTGGLSAFTAVSAGALIAQGIAAYWQAMAWVGPTAAGVTAFPGNVALAAALGALFADLSGKSAADKANDLASAFDAGAKAVVVSDVPFVQPLPPIVGPIN